MRPLPSAATALSRTFCRPAHRAVSRRRVIRAASLLLAACAGPVLAAAPDISNRSYIKFPDKHTSTNYIIGNSSSFVRPTAVAAGTQFALVGSGTPRLSTSLTPQQPNGSATYTANPVIVTGPWNGTPFKNLNINPPANPLGVERFGTSLAIHDNRVAIGSPEVFTWITTIGGISCLCVITFEQTSGSGRVHLYQYNGTSFAAVRSIVYGGLNERFGTAVALSATQLLAGRPGAVPGAADLFDPNTGSLITTFSSPATNDGFGETLALAGDLAIVGARNASTVYVYRRNGAGTWVAAGTLASPGPGSKFGWSISAEGERILVGAPGIDRAYVFEDDGDSDWPVTAELSGGADSGFGTAVALTGDTAFIAAPKLLFFGIRIGLVVRHDRANDGTWPVVTYKNARSPADGDNFGTAIAASTTMLTALDSLYTRASDQYVFTAPGNIQDSDSDGASNYGDNCPGLYNPTQADVDKDDLGNECDADADGDGLSNTFENNNGTNWLNPDTDGDGLKDKEDPYPLLPDSDHDGINNSDEIAAGTDPNNPDTDGDGYNDKDDTLPLDNGWAAVQHFDNFSSTERVLGSNVLLIERNYSELLAFAEQAGVWVQVDPPLIDGGPVPPGDWGRGRGKRFIFTSYTPGSSQKSGVHAFDWTPSNGWTHLGSIDVSIGVNASIIDLKGASIDGNRVAVVVRKDSIYELQLYDITPDGLELLATWQPGSGAIESVTVLGNYVMTMKGSYGGRISIWDTANNYALQTLYPPTDQYFTANLATAGSDRLLVKCSCGSLWLQPNSGVWALTSIGIAGGITGGDGQIIVHSVTNSIWGATRTSDATPLGTFPVATGGYITNGRVVVRANSPNGGTPTLDIYKVPAPPLPPGC